MTLQQTILTTYIIFGIIDALVIVFVFINVRETIKLNKFLKK